MNDEATLGDLPSLWEREPGQGCDISTADLDREGPKLIPKLEPRMQPARESNSLDQSTPAHEPQCKAVRINAHEDTLPSAPAVNSKRIVPGFEILGELGRGGMGVVYKARHVKLNRLVALKMILSGAHANEAELARFRAEAEAVAQLQHANIVQIHEIGEHDGMPYFALEFCTGGSLDRKLQGTPLPPREAASLIQTLARAMHHAHGHHLIHRDLKPANVLLTADGTPKVTDFGLAKKLDGEGLTCTGKVMGTPSYMPPEQAAGRTHELGPAADIYALGGVLYELLTGRPPFKGVTTFDTLQQVLNDEPVPPSRLQPKMPRDLETICLKCLQKDPQRRYDSALELAEDLRRFGAGEPIWARPVGGGERVWKWVRRHPSMAAMVAGLLFATVALAVAGFFAWQADLAEIRRQQEVRDNEDQRRIEKWQNAIDKALIAATAGDLANAEQAIAEAERYGASTGQVRMLRGQIAFHRGKTQEAIQHLEQATELLPDNVTARGMLASAYAYTGQWDRFDRALGELHRLAPVTAEDFLFRGYAEANWEPAIGLKSIDEAIERRPSMMIAKLLRAEVRAWLAGDRGNVDEAERAIHEAESAKEHLPGNPVAIWVSLQAQLIAAGAYGRNGQQEKLQAGLAYAKADADALKAFTALPDAIVLRWSYYRELGQENLILDELRRAAEQSDHVYLTVCHAITLYQQGKLQAAVGALEKRPGASTECLLLFLLAETAGPESARAAYKDYIAKHKDPGATLAGAMVLRFLGDRLAAKETCLQMHNRPETFPGLYRKGLWRCLEYNAGRLSAGELEKAVAGSLWDQCCAHYYIGMEMLAEGDRVAARKHFRKAVETKAHGWEQFDMSWVFLARLESDPTWPPWIAIKK